MLHIEYPPFKFKYYCTPYSKITILASSYIKLVSYKAVHCMVSTLTVTVFICSEERDGTAVQCRDIVLCAAASKPMDQSRYWKLIAPELVKMFSTLCGTRKFISFYIRAAKVLSLRYINSVHNLSQ
jgi:hypothetical protein